MSICYITVKKFMNFGGGLITVLVNKIGENPHITAHASMDGSVKCRMKVHVSNKKFKIF